MKKFLPLLIITVVLATIPLLPMEALPGSKTWVLYDDFGSGVIDTDLWDIDASSATISVEDGKAKFEHKVGFPGDSSWLILKKNPKKIKGVRTTVTVESCTGYEMKARVAVIAGEWGGGYVWESVQLRPAAEFVEYHAGAHEYGTHKVFHRFLDADLADPIEIIGDPFILTIVFSKKKAIYEASGVGKLSFKLPERLSSPTQYFRAIGTRTEDAEDGPCVVYFDDVYVYVSEWP